MELCIIKDPYDREIIGSSAGANKDDNLIKNNIGCGYFLNDIRVFDSDRGKQYDNKTIDEFLEAFKIE